MALFTSSFNYEKATTLESWRLHQVIKASLALFLAHTLPGTHSSSKH
ncbi:hypothetical protein HMPREF0168_1159 [Bifidobacterium dentium ATCC 27679]|uniref:Uncharacterized protein n=2 Tax=Bifidobacterium dentium TaxID=1689 RepID=E0Q7Q1_9BIFI|nr:hypothetical protein HMPREF0168_1159 [Bifidobacterium dentium ATCC 27679]EFO78045.1 hypothetical protein HMPREF9003_2241 [Bifidobacterium dentium JCVIHMP022]